MRKKIRQIMLWGCLALLTAYFFLTPIGALRGAVALSGHPIDAVMLRVRIATAQDVGMVKLDNPSNTTIYRITDSVPYDDATGTEAKNWIVIKLGPFCTAEYYGWC